MILITGGAGFICSHLVRKLLNENLDVAVIDNFNSFYDPALKRENLEHVKDRIELFETDIRDKIAIKRIFDTHKFETVIHLAAMAGVRPSIEDPGLYSEVNIDGTVNLLESCRKNGIHRFIFASSSSVYGNNRKVPFNEDDGVDYPISPYAATKKAGELLCHTYHHLFKLDVTCLRFFTVYGPSQRPEMAIHKFTRLLSEEKPLPVYGNGDSARDYTYIDDIIDGVYRAYQKIGGYHIYNLGESQTTTLNTLVSLIGKTLKKEPRIDYLPALPGDVERTFADISKARIEIDYSPSIKIEKGIEKFADWFQARKSRNC